MNSESPASALSLTPAGLKQLVRQHVHDLRNYLNCVGMEVALLGDDAEDPKAAESIESIRAQLDEADALMRKFFAHFASLPDE